VRRPRFIDPFQPTEVRRLVTEFGSPLLILDCERVRVQFRKLRKALPRVDLHYALKPMPHPAVVQTVIEEGGFLDLATTGEMQLVQRLGVAPDRCIHTHPIKREQDIANALQFGVRLFVADNPDEVRKFARLTAAAQLLLRVSFRAPGAVCDLSRKFGCDPEELLPLARLAADLGIGVRGLSFHVGSQTADAGKHVEALAACARLMAAARREIALARLEYQLAAPHDPSGAERLQHGKLSVVEFREGDVLCITIKLLVFVELGHKQIH